MRVNTMRWNPVDKIMAKLASDRTLLSFIRTSILTMSFAFGISKYGGAAITALGIGMSSLIFALGFSHYITAKRAIIRRNHSAVTIS